MKRLHTNIIFGSFAAMLLLFASCEKDPEVYDNAECYLRFVYNEDRLSDSTVNYSFAYGADEVTEDTVWFTVSIMGFTSDSDRPFILEQVKTGGRDAMAGEHYVPFDDAALAAEFYYIPRGKTERKVPVVLKRDASLKTDDYILRVTIRANKHFARGSKEFIYKNITFADRLIQPDNWDRYCNSQYDQLIFGPWGENKHRFMIRVTGEKWDNDYILNTWKNYMESDPGYVTYMKNLLKTELAKYNEELGEEGPLKDNGIPVSFD